MQVVIALHLVEAQCERFALKLEKFYLQYITEFQGLICETGPMQMKAKAFNFKTLPRSRIKFGKTSLFSYSIAWGKHKE